ncbi:hypothetical protein QZH41_013102 [Actinostola sp. cb2023]|nr:hypothetical protein QZH41_013102 [Actinostola sp. cb2023]
MAEASPSSEDRVSVYLVAPSPKVINTSPPCLKLETFLRMTNIAYKPFYGWKPSPKGKMPWIEYKGNIVADSYFSIKFLSKEFGVDLDEHLTNEQKGIATAFIVTLEENTYWKEERKEGRKKERKEGREEGRKEKKEGRVEGRKSGRKEER